MAALEPGVIASADGRTQVRCLHHGSILTSRVSEPSAKSGPPVAHVAKDLGIHKEALRRWVRQAEADKGDRPDLLTIAERAELGQLRAEMAELRQTNEILKAASGLFAKELDQLRTRLTR
ncbi:transposase [Streptomyces fagopyri]|uniref:transposase n=1 Tax=Streptomyces fagopyri TaxID=2662397 RepID=UPI003698F0F5